MGITAPIKPGGVFPIVSPQSVGKEKDRARYLHAKVWGSTNCASYDELIVAEGDSEWLRAIVCQPCRIGARGRGSAFGKNCGRSKGPEYG